MNIVERAIYFMKLQKYLRYILSVIVCVFLVFGLTACNNSEKSDYQTVNGSDTVINNGDSSNDDNAGEITSVDDDNKSDDSKVKYFNKLTGLETTKELSEIRPVAIMINNIYQALPQQGISEADVVYEILAEGGITRLLCLFTDYADLPETGSIRSSRDYFIDVSDAHDAIYVHCGGSPDAYETLAARKTENMDGIYFNTPFYRNEWRKQNMGMEHSMMTTGEKLVAGIEEKGYRTTSDKKQPFSFLPEKTVPDEGESATYASIEFSYYALSEFDYDAEKGVYLKSHFDEPHIDSNNDAQLAFENVIFLYADQGAVPGDDKGRIYVDFVGDGEGVHITGGKARDICWHKDTRTSGYTLYEADGRTELLLNPGKSYIAIAPLGAETVTE
ncbi:MAG: hypothetical protein DBX61_10695 [Clostridiales bacterium]|nr:MAG: hypothetical protein DBX61_10695 [Clostridiales bacterium]